ncbi:MULTISPECIES: DUF5709 domain-containing protein [unclassified Streptomyces]|uniref:DUF5709 domain-containing protein n=1 Tax=unclassified Streptomyces TaxID=2593676 RepID=UPI00332839F6
MNDADRGDDVYQPQQQPEASDLTEQLDVEDTLDNRGLTDALDEGYSPPERPWAVEDRGTTAAEQHDGETLDGRLARELPDSSDLVGDGLGDLPGGDGELWDAEVGTARAGRLTRQLDIDEPDTMAGEDVGIDGAGASAEEAAMHVVSDGRL